MQSGLTECKQVACSNTNVGIWGKGTFLKVENYLAEAAWHQSWASSLIAHSQRTAMCFGKNYSLAYLSRQTGNYSVWRKFCKSEIPTGESNCQRISEPGQKNHETMLSLVLENVL
jgi:hypothetical protein